MRYLENSYDKTKLKIDEASHLKRIYEDIKRKLEVVSQAHHRLEWSSNENVGIGIILHCIKLFLSGNDNKDMMGMTIIMVMIFIQEAGNFPSILDCMEAEIRNTKAELKELRAMHDDAHISKEAAQQELAKHEKVVYTERKQREVELQKMKKEAEEKKMQHERIERRIVSKTKMSSVLFTKRL